MVWDAHGTRPRLFSADSGRAWANPFAHMTPGRIPGLGRNPGYLWGNQGSWLPWHEPSATLINHHQPLLVHELKHCSRHYRDDQVPEIQCSSTISWSIIERDLYWPWIIVVNIWHCLQLTMNLWQVWWIHSMYIYIYILTIICSCFEPCLCWLLQWLSKKSAFARPQRNEKLQAVAVVCPRNAEWQPNIL